MNRKLKLISLKREEIFLYLEIILFYFLDLTSIDLLYLASIILIKNLYKVVREHRLQPKGCFCI